MIRRWIVPLAIIAAAIGSMAVVIADAPSEVRLAVLGPFMLVGPGFGLVGHLRLRDPSAELSLTITASFVLAVALAAAAVHSTLLTPRGALGVLAAVSIAGCLLQLRRGHRRADA